MTETPRITLYTYAMSPYAAKVHAALLYKGLPFTCRYVPPLRARKVLPVGHQVPVVQVGDEARNDSTPIAIWLDERFPGAPRLLPDAGPERDKLLAIDDWVSHRLIPSVFRSYPGEGLDRWINGWKLSYVMHNTAEGGLPWLLRWMWPFVVVRVPFVRRLLETARADGLSIHDAKFKLYDELVERLEGGPFLGGRTAPSLPDFAAYPQFALFWVMGFRQADDILQRPQIMTWLAAMKPFVDRDPPITPHHIRKNDLPVPGGSFVSPSFPGGRGSLR